MGEFNLVLIALLMVVGLLIFFLFRKSNVDKTQSDSIRDLERRITDLMIGQLKEMRDSQNGVSQAMQDQISSFTKEATQIKEELKQVQEHVKDVSHLRIFSRLPN